MYKKVVLILIKAIIHKSDFKRLVRFLGLLECGFYDFIYKKHLQAIKEGKLQLADLLLNHALEEDAHSKMLWGLVDGRNRPHRSQTHKDCHGIVTENPEYFTGKKSWIAKDGSGRRFEWHNTDGISQRYRIARAFFATKRAEDYDWGDSLAFMCVGENLGEDFYSVLANCLTEEKTVAILQKIATDEEGHKSYLWEALKNEVGIIRAYWLITKWNLRKLKALLLIPYDLHQITQRKKTSA